MKIKKIKIYAFTELSEKVQEKVLEKLFDINVDHEWWEYIYENAKTIGLKITAFDLDRGRHAKGKFLEDAVDVSKLIKENHGPLTETFKTACGFDFDFGVLVAKHKEKNADDPDYDPDDDREFETEKEDLEREFLRSMLDDYSIMLQKEYEYLTSAEAIKETLLANEYMFDEKGNLA